MRRTAIERQAALWKEYVDHRQWANDVYRRAGGTFQPTDPALNAELHQAWDTMKNFSDQFAFEPVSHFIFGGSPWQPVMPHVVLFLKREVLFPDEWGHPWATKRHVLQVLGRRGPTPETHDDILELADAAIRRVQRCEDGFYVRVARTLDEAAVRALISAVERDGGDNARRRAGYVRWALDNPLAPIELASWRRWVQT